MEQPKQRRLAANPQRQSNNFSSFIKEREKWVWFGEGRLLSSINLINQLKKFSWLVVDWKRKQPQQSTKQNKLSNSTINSISLNDFWMLGVCFVVAAAFHFSLRSNSCRGPFRSTNFNYSFHLLAAVINQFSLFHSINFFDWKRERVDLME